MFRVFSKTSLRDRCFQNHKEKSIHFWSILFLDGLLSNLDILQSYTSIFISKFLKSGGNKKESLTLPYLALMHMLVAEQVKRFASGAPEDILVLHHGQLRTEEEESAGASQGTHRTQGARQRRGTLRKQETLSSLGSFQVLCSSPSESVICRVLGILKGDL